VACDPRRALDCRRRRRRIRVSRRNARGSGFSSETQKTLVARRRRRRIRVSRRNARGSGFSSETQKTLVARRGWRRIRVSRRKRRRIRVSRRRWRMQWVRVSKALEAEAMEFGNGNGNECEP
jgi:hypothetical protein